MEETRAWKDITPQEVENLMKDRKDIQFIDVREVDEYRAGHIEGVKLIPLSQLDLRKDEIDKDRETVLICRSGNRSGRACEYLSSFGYRKLHNMTGGMLNWAGHVKAES